jgi:hypothetical protein
MDEQTKETLKIIAKWTAFILIIILLGQLANWVMVAYPLPHYVPVNTNPDLGNITFRK